MANQQFYCPYCKSQLEVRLGRDRPSSVTSFDQMRLLESNTRSQFGSNAMDIPGDWHRSSPVSKLEPRDVITSLMDAGVSFILVSAGALFVFWAAELPWTYGLIVGFGFGCLRYFVDVSKAIELLSVVERFTSRHEPEAIVEQQTVRVEVKNQKGGWQFADLPGEKKCLIEFAKSVLSGRSFSEREATRSGLTQEQFGRLRDIFVDRGWASWNHPTRKQQGITIARNGRAVLRAICA